ncbi:MAG: hypothetical protein U5K31_02500 [Balneolaceae bacterium]|nr:hypothetical protein [Balneolaceae bacterium]
MREICRRLERTCGLEWLPPTQAMEGHLAAAPRQSRRLVSSVVNPIPVKKKSKYNVSRWAVTGRDDLWLNTACHRLCRHLEQKEAGEEEWRELCELWSSDYRTHITGERWAKMRGRLDDCYQRYGLDLPQQRSGRAGETGAGRGDPVCHSEMEGRGARPGGGRRGTAGRGEDLPGSGDAGRAPQAESAQGTNPLRAGLPLPRFSFPGGHPSPGLFP